MRSAKRHSEQLRAGPLPVKSEELKPAIRCSYQEVTNRRFPITIRCSGDENVLVEYGEMELDLLLRFQVHALMEAIRRTVDPFRYGI